MISAVVPCFNQGRYLGEVVESLLGQRGVDGERLRGGVEVIVVNDGSTDETREVAARFGGRIRYVEQENGGVCAARNRGLTEARGELVHFIDADDYVGAGFYARILRAVRERPEAGFWYGDCHIVDEQKRFGWTWRAEEMAPPGDAFHACLARDYAGTCAAVIRREVVERAGGWDRAYRGAEDWELWIRIALMGTKFMAVPGADSFYRRHEDSTTGDFERMYFDGLRVIRAHSGHHGRCAKCAEAVRVGRREMRRVCVERSYWQSMGREKRASGMRGALGFLARTCWREPALVGEVLRRARRDLGALTWGQDARRDSGRGAVRAHGMMALGRELNPNHRVTETQRHSG
ncbi:MAG TPA: glycosyltransferase [Phycisphaerae bacterium]|nr:glycosyltransferase [Phycisphaerae bacterium]